MYHFKTRDDHKNWQHLCFRLYWIRCLIFHLPSLLDGASRALYKMAWFVCFGGKCGWAQKKSKNQTKVWSSRQSTYKALNQSSKGASHWYIHIHSCYSLSSSSWTLRIKNNMQVQLCTVDRKVDVESLSLPESMHFSSKVSILGTRLCESMEIQKGTRTKQPATTMMMVCISWSPAATGHVFWKANRMEEVQKLIPVATVVLLCVLDFGIIGNW